MDTIIEVQQKGYLENIIVTTNNLAQVREEIKGKAWSYFITGDTLITETVFCENATYGEQEIVFELRADGQVKPLWDTCGGPELRFQKVKYYKGNPFVKITGNRYYLKG